MERALFNRIAELANLPRNFIVHRPNIRQALNAEFGHSRCAMEEAHPNVKIVPAPAGGFVLIETANFVCRRRFLLFAYGECCDAWCSERVARLCTCSVYFAAVVWFLGLDGPQQDAVVNGRKLGVTAKNQRRPEARLSLWSLDFRMTATKEMCACTLV